MSQDNDSIERSTNAELSRRGSAPTNANAEVSNQAYYSDCLQLLIEAAELCLDEGLKLPTPYGTEFDLDGLLRMDNGRM